MPDIRSIDFGPEWEFRTSRSGGAGGQHVNKVETKVELRFNIPESALLTDAEKVRLLEVLAARLVQESDLVIVVSETRSQVRNKTLAMERFYDLLETSLIVPKKRKKRKMSKAAKEARLKDKKAHSEKKAARKWSGEG